MRTESPLHTVTLRRQHDRRVRHGHLWVFSNEIASGLSECLPGQPVRITDSEGRFLALGYANPHSLIAVRILTTDEEPIDRDFFLRRIRAADERRRQWVPDDPCYRMVFSESDGLPGLIIDRYAEYLVVQSLTSGIEHHLAVIADVLEDLFHPRAIVLRNDVPIRQLEDLPLDQRVLRGDMTGPVEVAIEGITYSLDLLHGQKTGFFLDQRKNHLLLRPFVAHRRVLDCFCYVGGWSLQAARFGAAHVLGIDSSQSAVSQSQAHAARNGLSTCEFRTADVFDELKRLNEAEQRFDVAVLDPPAFAKSRSQFGDAVKGYREINRRAAKALVNGGILITCSCSHLMDGATFRNTVLQGVQSAGANGILLGTASQPPDHPILLSMRETEYLKGLIIQIVR